VVAGAGAGAAEEVNVGPAGEAEAEAVGKVMVTPPVRQNCWANSSVAAWSAALQAVLIQVCTPLRKPVAVQIHVASVSAQPVLPIAVVAQETAHDGRPARLCAAASWRREETPTAARVKKRILAVSSEVTFGKVGRLSWSRE